MGSYNQKFINTLFGAAFFKKHFAFVFLMLNTDKIFSKLRVLVKNLEF